MIKIIIAIVLSICAIIVPFGTNDSVSAKSINGNPGIETPLSYLSYLTFAKDYSVVFDTRTYDNYDTTGILNIISYNTLSANNYADPTNRSSNTGYKIDYGDITDTGSIRPTQYQINVSSTSSSTRNYFQLFFRNGFSYNGAISVQIPLHYYYVGGQNDNSVKVEPNYYSNINVYVHYSGNTNATETTYSISNDDDFLYVSFNMTGGNILNFSVHYSMNTNTSYFNTGNYFTYWFDNVMFDTRGVDFNNGYLQGVTDANSTLNTDSVSYKTGYNNGVNTANSTINGSSASYQAGYNKGLEESSNLFELFSSAVSAPIDVLMNTFDFEILGVNVSIFLLSLLTLAFIVIVVRLLI